MSVMAFSPEFDTAFLALLNDKFLEVNDAFDECMKLLWENKLAYKLEKVHCKYFLPHKKKRGGLLLSPYNAHRNAAKIRRVGAKRSAITNAFAMEMPVDAAARDEHLNA